MHLNKCIIPWEQLIFRNVDQKGVWALRAFSFWYGSSCRIEPDSQTNREESLLHVLEHSGSTPPGQIPAVKHSSGLTPRGDPHTAHGSRGWLQANGTRQRPHHTTRHTLPQQPWALCSCRWLQVGWVLPEPAQPSQGSRNPLTHSYHQKAPTTQGGSIHPTALLSVDLHLKRAGHAAFRQGFSEGMSRHHLTLGTCKREWERSVTSNMTRKA